MSRSFLLTCLVFWLYCSNAASIDSIPSKYLSKAFGGGRQLKQMGGGGRCAWDVDSNACVVSKPAVVQLLSTSNSLMAAFALPILSCQLHESETTCIDASCAWTGGECGVGNEFFASVGAAGCFGEASIFLQIDERNKECESHKEQDLCLQEASCSWTVSQQQCVFDLVKHLTGLPTEGNQPQGLNQYLSQATVQLLDEFQQSFNATQNAPIRWNDVLDWNIAAPECPTGVSETVSCGQVGLSSEAKMWFVGKFSDTADLEACNRDAVCEGRWSQCDTSASLISNARLSAYKVFVDAVEDPLIQDIVNQTFTCSAVADEQDCQGNCAWGPNEGSCEMSTSWVNRKLGEVTGAQGDPACRFMAAIFQSGCLELNAMESCQSMEGCEWDTTDESCGPGEDVFRDVVLEDKPRLRRKHNQMKRACRKTKDPQSCENV